MQTFKMFLLSLAAVVFLGACSSGGSYEGERTPDRERSSSHRH